jgi:hypothetical protein
MNRADLYDGVDVLDGPDYLALVIEWDEDEVTAIIAAPPEPPAVSTRAIAAVLGALAALAVASWGLHRLRAA